MLITHITEEMKLGLGTSSSTSTHAFYSRGVRDRGRFSFRGCGNNQGWQDRPPQNFLNSYGAQGGGGNMYSSSRGRTSVTGARGRGRWQSQQQNASGIECHYCGKLGHMVKDCYKKQNDVRNGRPQHGNYASTSNNDGSANHLFAMTHVMGTMTSNSDGRDESWYMDSGASNHMTCHGGEWFDKMLPTQAQGYVVAGDDTQHAITHTGSVPLRMHDRRIKNMSNVLYVPSISKNLASVGQMVDQG